MSDDSERDDKRQPRGPGTTSDPNQSNRAREGGAEQPRDAPVGPVRGEPHPEERRDDAADPRKR